MTLSEDGRSNDSEGSEELACARNEHGKDALSFFFKKKSPASFLSNEGKETVGRGGGGVGDGVE
jgi:hypothetical protein